ncbi:vacuolar amino acid transporter [Scheffersomyces stipitis CBS 6054]|uniref:Vacuolar amino acid transporter n=1 Tax=Scheffersomyces stipitis (strain ATCC 58785 / CBS 6054 / NBRC 10063 / NRRL Y-11545) TaxID=322104 RepID=A3LTB1_PICST|nr:vacuolar amino acid transporter [Scheffersomyces stipitis CBS 6054]ABN66041.2 vacuolar amino acid transporter [Scheffersomyces stipitis CBS 6054]KAG2733254.1 hypothetical protein G9P44_004244 [Scheffersomyces stipitis]
MGRATIKSGTINLLNTIIGAGILAMPYGLKSNGLLFGCLLIIWSSLTSSFGLYLQNKVAKYTQQQGAVSYFSLAQLTYPQLSVVFDSAISIKCFGVGVSYLVVIGDLMPKIMESLNVKDESLFMERNFWITVFMVVLVVPLSYLKKLDSLKYTSVVALFSVVYLICLVIEHYVAHDIPTETLEIDWFGPKSIKSTLSSFPIFVFAYTCHQNMFAIINELKPSETDGSQTRQSNLIIRNAICTAAASYLVVGVIGYLTFGNSVNGNIITMYPKNSISSLIGRLCIVIMVSLSFPLQCHPCRGSVNHVIHFITQGVVSAKVRNQLQREGYTSLTSDIESLNSLASDSIQDESFISTTPMEGAQDTDGHDPIIVPLTSKKFYIITTVIVLSSYLVAITVTSLEHVLAFVGSTGSTSISFILPGLFGFLLIKPLGDATKLNALEKFSKYGGLALAIWGGIVMIVCLSATIFLGATH